MSVAIIQGSSSGLGLALTRHVLAHTSLSVVALTHRSGSRVKDDILRHGSEGGREESSSGARDRLTVVDGVDVREESGIERAATMVKEEFGGGSVRLIACMAGVLNPEKSLSSITGPDVVDSFMINTIGHLLTYKHFVPLVPSRRALEKMRAQWGDSSEQGEGGEAVDPAKGLVYPGTSLCWSMSARVGSIADNERGGWYSYRASKAALNQIIRCLDHELVNKSSSAVAVGYHPGTVLTPFTEPIIGTPQPDKAKGVHSVEDAVGYLTQVMGQVRRGAVDRGRRGSSEGEREWGGRCWDWKGGRVEW